MLQEPNIVLDECVIIDVIHMKFECPGGRVIAGRGESTREQHSIVDFTVITFLFHWNFKRFLRWNGLLVKF